MTREKRRELAEVLTTIARDMENDVRSFGGSPFNGHTLGVYLGQIDRDRYRKLATDAPHELAGAVNLIQKLGLVTETYDYPYWLKKVHEANFDHLEEEVKKAPQPRSD